VENTSRVLISFKPVLIKELVKINSQGKQMKYEGFLINQILLTMGLKKNIKELKGKLTEKEVEVEKLQKHINRTKFHEMEVECKIFADEAKRLRHLVETILRRNGIMHS
jgi:hypothetical protein